MGWIQLGPVIYDKGRVGYISNIYVDDMHQKRGIGEELCSGIESWFEKKELEFRIKEKSMGIEECRIIDLPKIADPKGNLTFIEGEKHIPFEIKRVFFLYDVPGGAERAAHALKSCHQFLVAMSGSFDVIVYDGKNQQCFHLNRPYYGLHLPPMIWREMDNFSSGSVCLALASTPYQPDDYYRDYDKYLMAIAELKE